MMLDGIPDALKKSSFRSRTLPEHHLSAFKHVFNVFCVSSDADLFEATPRVTIDDDIAIRPLHPRTMSRS